jgi:hypothetical protein
MVLSDFEPFTSRGAKLAGIPVIQLNHPGIVDRSKSLNPAAIASRIVARYMMGHSDRRIICSFFDGDVGPIIRTGLRCQTISREGYFVVYQKKIYARYLEPLFAKFGSRKFRLFPSEGESYERALAGAEGLIAPAGHQSISEALALGKPVFVIPIENQYEQELNAQKLAESGFGDWCYYQELETRLPIFIQNIDHYAGRLENAKKNGGTVLHGQSKWQCTDDTMKAVSMIEAFMEESAFHPEWKRTRLMAPLIAALYP